MNKLIIFLTLLSSYSFAQESHIVRWNCTTTVKTVGEEKINEKGGDNFSELEGIKFQENEFYALKSNQSDDDTILFELPSRKIKATLSSFNEYLLITINHNGAITQTKQHKTKASSASLMTVLNKKLEMDISCHNFDYGKSYMEVRVNEDDRNIFKPTAPINTESNTSVSKE